jgi:hypothetical protein
MVFEYAKVKDAAIKLLDGRALHVNSGNGTADLAAYPLYLD